jgi:hypothetical protein
MTRNGNGMVIMMNRVDVSSLFVEEEGEEEKVGEGFLLELKRRF